MLRLLPLSSPVARAFVLLLAALAVAPGGRSQHAADAEIAFERAVRVEAALPQSSVYEIREDRRGFLWFATREGLGRWDGTTMRTWRRDPFDRASLPGNIVRQLIEDGAGDLWVRAEATDWTPKGIARLVGPGHEAVRRYGHAGALLMVGPDGEAWLADSTHLWRFSREADRFVRARPRLHRAPATVGLATRDGALWVASADGLAVYTGGAARAVPFDEPWTGDIGNNPHHGAMAEAPDGTLWIAGSRLGRLRGSRQRVETLPLARPEIAGYGDGFGATRLLPDRGGLWMASLNGVYRYTPSEEGAGTLARHSLRLPGDIETQNWVTGLHRDRAGTLWAGTVWGLHRATPGGRPFRLIAHDPDDPDTIGSGIVLSIARDPRGSLWIGTLGGGLNRIAPGGAVTRYRHDPEDAATLPHDWVWSLAADRERVWIGTGEGLASIALDRPGRVRRHLYRESPRDGYGPSANSLHLDSTGTLWFGHIGGLYRRAPSGAVEVTDLATSIEAVRTVPGGAWVTTAEGLRQLGAGGTIRAFRHDPADPRSLSDDAALAAHVDGRGRLWVGTQSGLDRYDPATGGFEHFTTRDGLPSSVVYAILEDDRGRLWISTNRGLARYDERAAAPFRAYTEADGVGNVEFNRHAAWRDPDGTLYFGGDRGVTVFHPDDLAAPARSHPVVVTAVHRATREGSETAPYAGAGTLTLAPGVTTFGFAFAALDFTSAHLSRYAVRLDGWDEDWVEVGDRQEVSYTNLPPGRYTFRVRAAAADGGWGEEAAPVPLVVRPAWWETWAFRAALALGLVALVAGVGWDLSRRRYRRELAALRARQALDAERARISRDMHDEVGASLSEIAILSELAQLSASGDGAPAAPTGRLRQIAETSRETLDAIGEIVWALNPTNDRLPTLAAYLREHAARYAESTGLHATLRFPSHPPDRPVSAEVRRAVFLVLKEALHNVVKHAGASAVDVTLALAEDRLTLIVADDGCGLAAPPGGDGAPARVRGGNGLGNMRQRAAEIGGAVEVSRGERGGTIVRLTVPLGEGVRTRENPPSV